MRVTYVIFGGIFVPFVAIGIGRIMKASWLVRSSYAVLAAVAPIMELAAIPIMIFLRDDHVGALPGILMICEGVHYLVYMWIHLEYYYFILAYLKVLLGILFLFGIVFADNYGEQLLTSGSSPSSPLFSSRATVVASWAHTPNNHLKPRLLRR